MKSMDHLPDDYVLDREIHLEKDKKLFWFVNIASLFIFIPFGIIALVFQFQFTFHLNMIIFYIPLMIGSIIVHELVHGLFFKLGTKQKVRFGFHGWAASASVPGVYFYKDHYLKVGLAPAVLVNGLLIILIVLLPNIWFFPLYLTLAVHFSGCIGDFYVSFILSKYDKSTLIEDIGVGMKLYTPMVLKTSD